MTRFAGVTGAADSDAVAALLPGNYRVFGHRFPGGGALGSGNPEQWTNRIVVLIEGADEPGSTLHDDVVPRLAANRMYATEVVT